MGTYGYTVYTYWVEASLDIVGKRKRRKGGGVVVGGQDRWLGTVMAHWVLYAIGSVCNAKCFTIIAQICLPSKIHRVLAAQMIGRSHFITLLYHLPSIQEDTKELSFEVI